MKGISFQIKVPRWWFESIFLWQPLRQFHISKSNTLSNPLWQPSWDNHRKFQLYKRRCLSDRWVLLLGQLLFLRGVFTKSKTQNTSYFWAWPLQRQWSMEAAPTWESSCFLNLQSQADLWPRCQKPTAGLRSPKPGCDAWKSKNSKIRCWQFSKQYQYIFSISLSSLSGVKAFWAYF